MAWEAGRRRWGFFLRSMIQLHKVSPRASKKNCNQSGPYPDDSHIGYNAFELRGYTVKKHGRHRGMRDERNWDLDGSDHGWLDHAQI